MTTLTTDELVKKAYHAGVVRWDVAKELVELITKTEREACAKVCEDGLNIATSLQALDDMEIWGEKFANAIRARGEAT